MSATVSNVQPAATSSSGGGGGGGSGPTSSPLLFFVALGFGVVFTNLWIIVGVKYCFRYNQRNRAARAAADGEPIDLAAMPRTHRRRREKKLMTMDEVNERFPLTKYKHWKVSREHQGLPAAGGIATAPQSRAASLKDVEAVVAPVQDDSSSSGRPATAISTSPEDAGSKRASRDHGPATESSKAAAIPEDASSAAEADKEKDKEPEKGAALTQVATAETSQYQPAKDPATQDGDETDDDDPIRTAAAPELLGEPGDTCAICLDTLEDDDDVRGLTCGHAFHASCLDPWLTSRRACCPLCKADYFVPKPRPDGESPEQASASRRTTGLRSPTSPAAAWPAGRGNPFTRRSRVAFVHGPAAENSRNNPRQEQTSTLSTLLGRPSRRDRAAPAQSVEQGNQNTSWASRFTASRPSAPSFSNWFGRNRNAAANDAAAATTPPTPAQLEAGNR